MATSLAAAVPVAVEQWALGLAVLVEWGSLVRAVARCCCWMCR